MMLTILDTCPLYLKQTSLVMKMYLLVIMVTLMAVILIKIHTVTQVHAMCFCCLFLAETLKLTYYILPNLDLNSQDQLMVLYTARMNEVSHLTKELATLRNERDTEVEQLKRKLLLVEAEKQGAFLSHKEAQSLLGEQDFLWYNVDDDLQTKLLVLYCKEKKLAFKDLT